MENSKRVLSELKKMLVYEYLKQYSLTPLIEWTPSSYPVDHANTLFVDSSTLFSIKAAYHSPHGYQLFFEGKNLFDSKWISTSSVTDNASLNLNRQAMFYPGTGISFYAGIEYQF